MNPLSDVVRNVQHAVRGVVDRPDGVHGAEVVKSPVKGTAVAVSVAAGAMAGTAAGVAVAAAIAAAAAASVASDVVVAVRRLVKTSRGDNSRRADVFRLACGSLSRRFALLARS